MNRWISVATFAFLIFIASSHFSVAQQKNNQKAQEDADPKPGVVDTASKPVKMTMDVPSIYHSSPLIPEDNKLTEEKAKLGKELFFDTILSDNGSVSCASCHTPEHGFATSDPIAIGADGAIGDRNAPSLINTAFSESFFWDGRVDSLETQSLQPIENEKELNSSIEAVLKRLKESDHYVQAFQSAFAAENREADNAQAFVTDDNLAKALASFQRTLIAEESPVDQFQGGNYSALSTEARQGLWLFESRANCWKCHSGDRFSDNQFHNTGISFSQATPDEGRYKFTQDDNDKRKFKTPMLRGVAKTAPYMHDGSIKTLREVIEFYNRGGNRNDPNLSSKLKPLKLSEREINLLVAFLEALSE